MYWGANALYATSLERQPATSRGMLRWGSYSFAWYASLEEYIAKGARLPYAAGHLANAVEGVEQLEDLLFSLRQM